jgi:hypothetical protein
MRKEVRKIVMEGQNAIGFRCGLCVKKDRILFQMPKDIKLPLHQVLPALHNG